MNAADRFKAGIAAILDELIPNRKFFAPVRYVVTKAQGGKLNAVPAIKSLGYPPLNDVPIRGLAAANAGSKLRSGSSVMIAFAHGDRADPFLLDVLDDPTEYAISATAKATVAAPLIKLDGASVQFNSGAQPVARVGDTVMGIFAITSGNPTVKA